MNLDEKLTELYGQHLENPKSGITLQEYLGLQRALRISQEAELIMDRVESINNNGETK